DLVHILGEGSVAWMPTPYIIAVHELPHLYRQKVGEFKRSLYASIGQSVSELFLPRTCRRATSILALSHSTADDLIQEYRVAAEKVSVAYPAANNIFFQVSNQERSRWCENLPQPYLLTFATGDRREVPSQVVEAFGQICRQVSHCLVIAGKCPDWQKSELIAIAKQQGCAERLYFTGYVPDAELPFLYRDADIFIELSRYEGFGLQVCEAMATGTDVITTDVSSLPEVVGSEGHLVALNDPSQLGTTIAKILTQPKSHATEKSLCNQAATFSWDTCSQLTWLAMKSIVYE
ncbi:MAG: glycosyltransferase family 1 protein, partial [Cyanobacteria bacterium J06576_12]